MRLLFALCSLLVSTSALAQDRCVETAALSAAAAKVHQAKKPNAGVTLCHVAIGADDCTRTIVLPAALAKKHVAEHTADWSGVCESSDMVMVAVSGTLEEGFPLRPNLDYTSPTEKVPSVFLGRALIRGLRAHLDMKDPQSREYKAPPELNPVNPALIPSGNELDANVSSIYLVDRRQAARALLNEPRFLSMVPDLAKADIDAAETSPDLRKLLQQAIKETPGITNNKNVTFLQVISVWNSCHFLPSPVLYIKPDGTRVTDFPNSLAKFAGTSDATRVSDPGAYNAAVEKAVRAGVEQTAQCSEPGSLALGPSGHYGVDKFTKRMNDAYRPCAFEELAARAGLTIDIPQCPN